MDLKPFSHVNCSFVADQEVVVNASFKPRYGRRTTHPSIWWQEQRFQKHQVTKIGIFLMYLNFIEDVRLEQSFI